MGVGRTKLGKVVAITSDADEKKERTSSNGSTGLVALFRGYSPIIGGSFVSIPRLLNSVQKGELQEGDIYIPEDRIYRPQECSA